MSDLQSMQSPQTLMIQGTTSDAGKSILTAALCRILARNKIPVAPFKPQNMALNSAVTQEGGEIGRAQAVQAQACFLAPSILMNPVLLKPNSETGSQIIVNGQAIGNMDAKQYHAYKPKLLNAVVTAHQQLQQQYQVVLVEGAGSPAEINLRQHDIANMGFAEAIDCPVILVADIERGGVFAHLYGTWALLSPTEKQRIKGFVINRFRGDVSLLDSGLTWLEQKTGVPVLGVIPYVHDLHIEAEDSLGIASTAAQTCQTEVLNVVVPRLPRISNHTDFDCLSLHPQVNIKLLSNAQDFEGADLIILPGSKSVRSDLQWLKNQGWDHLIQRHLRYGGKLMGICGGFQMLGQGIDDPLGIEGPAGSSQGFGYLEMHTTLAQSKSLAQVQGVFLATECSDDSQGLGDSHGSGIEMRNQCVTEDITIQGYEIHAGLSTGEGLARPAFKIGDRYDGAWDAQQNVLGSYIHGVLDTPEMLGFILRWSGLKQVQDFDYPAHREQELNRIADVVEQVIPLTRIKALLSLEADLC